MASPADVDAAAADFRRRLGKPHAGILVQEMVGDGVAVVLSSRIADAQINYDGKGFVSRSAKPGIVNRILSFLGIG